MKHQILSILTVYAAMSAAAQTAPSVEWGKLIDGTTSSGDQSTEVVLNSHGDIFWYGTYGSTESALDISYDGSLLYSGAPYVGTSVNNNFTLLKTNPAGEKLALVYSNSGDFANNAGGAAATGDGGVIVVSKVRHTDGMTDRNIVLVDNDGDETVVDWTCERRYYRMMVTKITADGNVSWNRMIDFSTEPGPNAAGNNADFWADCFNVGSVACDHNDNVYIALNYRNPISVAKADGSVATFTPVNTADWTGDAQSAVGDFMLLGLDSEGYYRNSLQLQGSAAVSYCQKVVYADGQVFAQGYITGNGTELSAGDCTLSPSNIMSPLVVAVDTDFNVSWAKCFPAEQVAGKNALQNVGIASLDGKLFMVGQYNLKFSDPADPSKSVAATQGTLREGFVLSLDATTGQWLAARDSRDDDFSQGGATAKTGLTGYMSVIGNPEHPDAIYVIGYVMNANVGVFMRRYDASTLVADLDAEYNVVTQGGVPSYQSCAYDPRACALYLTARGNKAFNLMGNDATAAPSGWGILAAKVNLPEELRITTGVSDIELPDGDNTPVEYYNLQGMRVEHPVGGIYIRRSGTTVTKVIKSL